ncbi:MAG: hypothetical protein ACOCXQ_04795 [Patescibacteria group bacterium]
MNKRSTIYFSIFIVAYVVFLGFTRMVNMEWGLPYPLHPDERNMAVAVMQLGCNEEQTTDCFHPNFFAYGQITLYLAYMLIKGYHFITASTGASITFNEATLALRAISAFASIATGLVLLQSLRMVVHRHIPKVTRVDERILLVSSFLIVFVPGFIQMAHFGTTESLLMLYYSLLILFSIRALYQKVTMIRFLLSTSVICGLAIATKVSALPFIAVPLITLMSFRPVKGGLKSFRTDLKQHVWNLVQVTASWVIFAVITAILSIVLSPYNFLDYEAFRGSMDYESAVGFGTIEVFYTRQFFQTTPVLFQFVYTFPFVLGWPIFMLFIIAFFSLPWKRDINLMRLAFLIYFVPQAVLFTKWSRFMAPVLPVMVLFSLLGLFWMYRLLRTLIDARMNTKKRSKRRFILHRLVQCFVVCIILISMIPGIAYLSIYLREDIRFTASKWMYDTMEDESYILAETANVIDLPILPEGMVPPDKRFTNIPFDFYNLHSNPILQRELERHIAQADYIIVPSRRIFSNHTCLWPPDAPSATSVPLVSVHQYRSIPDPVNSRDERCQQLQEKYPQLHEYYQSLFSGELGFELVAEFTSYPNISLLGQTIIEFPDERAEETWTVFDHPVIRVYKRVE